MKTIIASVIGVLLFAVLGAMAALAIPNEGPYYGNPLDWCPDNILPDCAQYQGVTIALRQSLIGSKDVAGNLVQVCSPQFPNSTHIALDRWNWQLHFSFPPHTYVPNPNWPGYFEWDDTCGWWTDVSVGTEYFTECPDGAHACAYTYANLDQALLDRQWVALDPELFDGSPYGDGDPHTSRDIAHELGHTFGAGEYPGCPYGAETVMDNTESCPHEGGEHYGIPMELDVYNYFMLYHPPEVQDARCDPKCDEDDATVYLHWSPIVQDTDGFDKDMPNEKAFVICRDMAGTTEGDGCFWWVEKDSDHKTLYSQPEGVKTYAICSISDKADNSSPNNIECAMVADDPVPTHTPRPTKTPTITPTPLPDADGDGVLDEVDNCRDLYNPSQKNTDHSDGGDACDVCTSDGNNDADNDGICAYSGYLPPKTGDEDNCPAVWNPDQLNSDRTGRPNGSQIPGDWASNPISDNQGDACDLDSDNDGLYDVADNPGFFPQYPCLDPHNPDSDGDRSLDLYEVANGSNPCDAASKPTCGADPDSDGDGIKDCLEEGGYNSDLDESDSDGDGCPDWLEIMDLNGDRKVDAGDVNPLNERVANIRPASDSDPLFDVNKDGPIDVGDKELMAANTCASKGYACPCSPEYEPSATATATATATPVAPAVGGIAEYPEIELPSASTAGGSSSPPYAAPAGAAAGSVLLLATGAWYVRRRQRAG